MELEYLFFVNRQYFALFKWGILFGVEVSWGFGG